MFGTSRSRSQAARAPPRTWQEVEADLLAHANDPIEVTPLLVKKLADAALKEQGQ